MNACEFCLRCFFALLEGGAMTACSGGCGGVWRFGRVPLGPEVHLEAFIVRHVVCREGDQEAGEFILMK